MEPERFDWFVSLTTTAFSLVLALAQKPTYPFGERPIAQSHLLVTKGSNRAPAFQSAIFLRSFCLRVSHHFLGVVAPSAPFYLFDEDKLISPAGINWHEAVNRKTIIESQ